MKVKNFGSNVLSIYVNNIRYQFSPLTVHTFDDKDELLVDKAILPYPDLKVIIENEQELIQEQSTYQAKVEKGQPNGYAPLDPTGKVPEIYLPPISSSGSSLAKERFSLTALDVSNKYVDLSEVPLDLDSVMFKVRGGCDQFIGLDFSVVSDGSLNKRVSWSGLGLDGLLEENDIVDIFYNN